MWSLSYARHIDRAARLQGQGDRYRLRRSRRECPLDLGNGRETAGNTAVIVKLFRVFLMLPLVLAIGWFFARRSVTTTAARVPIPVFAIVFVALCVLNSIAPAFPPFARMLAWIKAPLIEASTWGLLLAISALGLGTSLSGIAALGWRHVATVTGTTLVIFAVMTAGLMVFA